MKEQQGYVLLRDEENRLIISGPYEQARAILIVEDQRSKGRAAIAIGADIDAEQRVASYSLLTFDHQLTR